MSAPVETGAPRVTFDHMGVTVQVDVMRGPSGRANAIWRTAFLFSDAGESGDQIAARKITALARAVRKANRAFQAGSSAGAELSRCDRPSMGRALLAAIAASDPNGAGS